jgi:hypothetical protein
VASTTDECGALTRGLKRFVRFRALDVAFPGGKKTFKKR